MKTLLATASASVLLLAAAACSEADAPYETAGYETNGEQTETVVDADGDVVEKADADIDGDLDGDAEASTRMEYTLAEGEIEASDLIGASVHSSADEEIATVADIFMGTDGMEPVLLVRDGGVSGLGGDLRTLNFGAATMTATDDGDEPNVIVAISEETLETLPEFEQEEMNDFRLASELMGSVPAMSFNGDQARVNDLILTETGELRYAVISPGLVSTDQIVIDAEAIQVAEGDGEGEVTIEIDQAAFDEAPMYRWE